MATEDPGWPQDRFRLAVGVVARLPAARDPDEIQSAAGLAYVRGQQPFASRQFEPEGVNFQSLVPGLGGGAEAANARIAMWAAGVSLIVFLISVANVTNLFLVRAVGRRQEIAVRAALGMGTARMMRQLLTESSVIALLGGGLGAALATWGGDAVIALLLPDVAPAVGWLPGGVAVTAVAAAAVAALAAGMSPALHARAQVRAAILSEGHATAGRGAARTRSTLLVAQTALSMMLLFGAGLFVLSLWRVQEQDLGLQLGGVLVATPTTDESLTEAGRRTLFERGAQLLRTQPGVATAAATATIPFGPRVVLPVSAPDVATDPFEGRQMPYLNPVYPEYFDLLGIRLTRGRAFDGRDRRGAEYVTIVSEGMADALWPNGDPLDKCVRITTDMSTPSVFAAASQAATPCRRVIGVASAARRSSIRPEDSLIVQYYVPHEQLEIVSPGQGPTRADDWAWLIKLRRDDATAASRLQRALQASVPGVRFVDVRPYADLIEPQVRPWRLGASLFSVFGMLAVGMAGLGTYSMLAYAIRQQRREVGIRMALGATSGAVVALVARRGLMLASLGAAVGAAGCVVLGRRLAPLLFETSGLDGVVVAAAALALGAAVVVAGAIPARRAARTDPASTLRDL